MSSWILCNSHHGFAFHSVTSILRPAISGVLSHSKEILSLSMYCINMLFNLPFICSFIFFFVFFFIPRRIFSLMISDFQVETSYCLSASTPESALCFQ